MEGTRDGLGLEAKALGVLVAGSSQQKQHLVAWRATKHRSASNCLLAHTHVMNKLVRGLPRCIELLQVLTNLFRYLLRTIRITVL